jgi:O-antigen/teichoic acid export membrane protein
LDGGFRTILNRNLLAAREETERWELMRFGQKLYSWISVMTIAAATALMAIYGLMPGSRKEGVAVSFFVCFGLTNALLLCGSIQSALFVGRQQQDKLFKVQTLGSWLTVATLAWAFRNGMGIWALPLSSFITFLCAYALTLFWVKKSLPELRVLDFSLGESFWNRFHALKKEAWFCFRMQVTTFVLLSADVLIIGVFCNKPEVAVYYILVRLVGMARTFLQTGGEVGWPFIAQRGSTSLEEDRAWFRLHAWIYGSTAGALCIILAPFCAWYLGHAWTAGNLLVWLVVLRTLIQGLASSVTYLFYARGRFHTITRCLEGELVVSVLFALCAGYLAPTDAKRTAVAVAFLAGTVGGTLLPVFVAYAREARTSLLAVLGDIWSRALFAFCASFFTGKLLSVWLASGIFTPVVGSLAAAAGVLLACLIAFIRGGLPTSPMNGTELRRILSQI